MSIVTGKVNVDGKPLEKGVISFVPADAKGTPVTEPIENGSYTINCVAGKKFVQISSQVITGKKDGYDQFSDERLPAKYNAKTELTFEATAGGVEKTFDLQTK